MERRLYPSHEESVLESLGDLEELIVMLCYRLMQNPGHSEYRCGNGVVKVYWSNYVFVYFGWIPSRGPFSKTILKLTP